LWIISSCSWYELKESLPSFIGCNSMHVLEMGSTSSLNFFLTSSSALTATECNLKVSAIKCLRQCVWKDLQARTIVLHFRDVSGRRTGYVTCVCASLCEHLVKEDWTQFNLYSHKVTVTNILRLCKLRHVTLKQDSKRKDDVTVSLHSLHYFLQIPQAYFGYCANIFFKYGIFRLFFSCRQPKIYSESVHLFRGFGIANCGQIYGSC
jgi:hypothetical protein